jgi:hypothetical protein
VDVVAIDTVGCAVMGIDPAKVRTIHLGAATGLGESDINRMEIVGDDLKRLKFRVELPQEKLRRYFPELTITGAEKACSGCLIPLVSSLLSIGEAGMKIPKPITICLGKDPGIPAGNACLLVGDCAIQAEIPADNMVEGCPPDQEKLKSCLVRVISV